MTTVKTDAKRLLEVSEALIHSEDQKVISHTQKEQDQWIMHTLMIEGCDIPFKFKRPQRYKSLRGARVNMTYYRSTQRIAGLEFEMMQVVRIKRS